MKSKVTNRNLVKIITDLAQLGTIITLVKSCYMQCLAVPKRRVVIIDYTSNVIVPICDNKYLVVNAG